MADADTSRARLIFRKETAFNEATPANPAMTALRFLRANFKQSNQTVVSNDIRSDRGRSDLLLVGTDVAGGFGFELAADEYDAFIASVLSGTWAAGILKNGVVAPESYQFEHGQLDIGQHLLFKGLGVNEMNLTIPSRGIVTGDFGMMGTVGLISATSVLGTGTLTGPATTGKISSGPGINNILINAAPIGVGVREIRLNIRGNLRTREVVDSLVTRQHGRGAIDITGTVALYFANSALYNYFIANTLFTLAFTLATGTATGDKAYDILLPACKPPDDNIEVTGIDSDIVETFAFRALHDPTENAQIKITKRTLP